MTMINRPADPAAGHVALMSRDHDVQKGAMEDGYASTTMNAPGLDADGMPNDEGEIAAHALGARVDGSQG